MGNYIDFYSKTEINGCIFFAVLPGAYKNVLELKINPDSFFCELSSNNSFIAINEEEKIYIYTSECMLTCVKSEKEEGVLLIKYVNNNTIGGQNKALSKGVRFKTSGIVVKITIQDYPRHFYYNGEDVNPWDLPSIDEESIKKIFAQSFVSKEEKEKKIDKAYSDKVNRRFNRILDLAENYSDIYAQAEASKVNSTPPLIYSDVIVSDYTRIDRIEYVFIVAKFENTNYKVGSQVQINESLPAEIVRINELRGRTEITVLFHDQVDKKEIKKTGQIHLSYMSTISDVQKAAIHNLRSNQSIATNLNNIIGGFETEPYIEREKLSKRKLSKKLNDRQVNALMKAINVQDIMLIMGPPGTGKTSVIIELIKYLVCEKKLRVLVSSQNNTAIDNVMRLLPHDDSLEENSIRIGTETKVAPEVTPLLFENKVRDYRKKISRSTENSLIEIENNVKEIEELFPQIEEYVYEKDEIAKRYSDFDRDVGKILFKAYETTERYKDQATNKIQERNRTATVIKSLYNKVENYTPIYFPIIHKIKESQNENDKNELKNKIKKYKKIQEEVSVLIGNYEQSRINYLSLEKTYYEIYEDIYKSDISYQKQWADFLQKCMVLTDNWLFQLSISADLKPTGVKNLLDKEIERLIKLKEVIEDWKLYTSTTQNYAFGTLLLDSVKLVGATCIGINSQKKFDSLKFDVAIIDEAGQIQLQNALVPMSVSRKTIMLGDYQQLPPIVDPEIENHCREHGIDTQLLSESFFEYLYNNLPSENKIMLDTQYRLPSQISDILSEFFYNGEYHSCDEKKNISGRIGIWNTPCIIVDTSKVKNRHEKRNTHYCNELEAKAVYYIVSKLLKQEVYDENEIHIIAPYNEQVELIREEFEKGNNDNLYSKHMKYNISSLDSYQGQECDLIVYSFTRSSFAKPDQKRIGFLSEIRRLNVAMSRGKQNLILIGDMEFLSNCKYQEIDDNGECIYEGSEKRFSDFIATLIEHVKKTGTIVDCNQLIKAFEEQNER